MPKLPPPSLSLSESEAGNKPVSGSPGSLEQQAIWDELQNGNRHTLVSATAGSGKTYTIVEYAKREKSKTIGLVAFNKHIATELTQRMGQQPNVQCMTYHSLGNRACRSAFRTELDEGKVWGILDEMKLAVTEDKERLAKGKIKSLVGLAKQYGAQERPELEKIVDRHAVDLNGLEELVLDTTPIVLRKCKDETRTIDFDDMVWLPHVLNLPAPQFDVLCVDEYQDTGLTQQSLALKGGKRIVAVGDPNQAIYSWRGADSRSFDRLRETLGEDRTVTLPLTLTRRCPKSHVKLAQRLVPQIRAMDDAPEGIIRGLMLEGMIQEVRPGDLVLCRVNADLLSTAYRILKRGVKAVVRGRDIGQGMIQLLDKAIRSSGGSLQNVLKEAAEITELQVMKFLRLPNNRGEMRAMAAQDKLSCLLELAGEVKSTSELRGIIESLFADFEADGKPKHAVVLGTVHRTKGLEANRVYILRPELIPHPMAKTKEDWQGERNLGYVAVTRSRGELIFVGGECSLFSSEE